ncbi:hypothetical protein CHS0354_037450 [Potamilus streckersoni]|uniref:NADP-dependent oxidoreductase domain-containing protein n=1 Tax=Potamilus streckersoni TaxID=2493646 RepID=A0AAE0RP98_9BIVA|nr:hypothetical protein CHS0354_037450 [Potamilus streckersoni]
MVFFLQRLAQKIHSPIYKQIGTMLTKATSIESQVRLNDGVDIPMFGLGVYESRNGGEAERAVTHALNHKYRLIDTAEFYQNEEDCGTAIRKSDVARKDIFLVTKLWDNGAKNCQSHFKTSYKKLGLDYVDMYLIHSPNGNKIVETYKTMLDLKGQGLIRSVGVSNFGVQHLKGLEEAGLPLPSVNQIELHPWQRKEDIVAYCRQKGIHLMAYSPLAKGHRFGDKNLVKLAQKYNKTEAQVLIRWCVQHGFIVIPKSANPKRIEENAKVFDWSISEEDMKLLNSLPEKSCTWNPCVKPWEG